MTGVKYLNVGGVVAMGFDPNGDYLLVVSHAGRGVFSTKTWERVARNRDFAYPASGHGIGIGPIDGVSIEVTVMDFETDQLQVTTPDGRTRLDYESGTITVSAIQA
jgi:hypothetical protein